MFGAYDMLTIELIIMFSDIIITSSYFASHIGYKPEVVVRP